MRVYMRERIKPGTKEQTKMEKQKWNHIEKNSFDLTSTKRKPNKSAFIVSY